MRYLVLARPSLIVSHIVEELNSIGHETRLIALNDFSVNCSRLELRLYKWGFKSIKKKYEQKFFEDVKAICEEFKPENVLILCGMGIPKSVKEYIAQFEVTYWIWDSVKRFPELEEVLTFTNKIFCFEYDDVDYLSKKYNIPTKYLPLGADDKVYYPIEKQRDLDIVFVGTPYKNRTYILEKVCEEGQKRGWKIKIGGPWYKETVWKKYRFHRKSPYLSKCIENRHFKETEVAELYRRSKICLNINEVQHKSLNPRTFEICATKSFQMMNAGQDSRGWLEFQRDVVIYDNEKDLIEKIEYYLTHEEERKRIAQSGYEAVMAKCTLKKLIADNFA